METFQFSPAKNFVFFRNDCDEKVNKLLNTRLFGPDLKFWCPNMSRCPETIETKREIKA